MRKGMRIRAIAAAFGNEVVTSEQIETLTGSPAEFRKKKLGINEVRIASPNQTTATLAVDAINNLFHENSNLDKNSLEFLILVTQNPDYKLPTTACLVQHLAGLNNNILAYDVNQGCSGFIVALAQAKGLIASGIYKRGVIVTSDAYNKIIDKSDRDTFGLFGDAASAIYVEESPEPSQGVGEFFFGSDGSGGKYLILRNGGLAFPDKNSTADDFLYMDGKAIFRFVAKTLPESIKQFLGKHSTGVEDIDQWFFHQANKHMNSRLCEELRISEGKAFFDIANVGNTVSSSVPIALMRAMQQDFIAGKTMFLCGFGVGLSWGGCFYNLTNGKL